MKLIDLALLRKVNHVPQKDIAAFLGVSRPYVSQVETGANNLSDENIDKLLFYFDLIPDSLVLVPCFHRLRSLVPVLQRKYEDVYYETVDTEGDNELFLPLLGVLSEETILSIRHGRLGITDAIADIIIRYFPLVNKEWLTSGTGSIMRDDTMGRLQNNYEIQKGVLEHINGSISGLSHYLYNRISKQDSAEKEFNKKLDDIIARLDIIINKINIARQRQGAAEQFLLELDKKIDRLLIASNANNSEQKEP